MSAKTLRPKQTMVGTLGELHGRRVQRDLPGHEDQALCLHTLKHQEC